MAGGAPNTSRTAIDAAHRATVHHDTAGGCATACASPRGCSRGSSATVSRGAGGDDESNRFDRDHLNISPRHRRPRQFPRLPGKAPSGHGEYDFAGGCRPFAQWWGGGDGVMNCERLRAAGGRGPFTMRGCPLPARPWRFGFSAQTAGTWRNVIAALPPDLESSGSADAAPCRPP